MFKGQSQRLPLKNNRRMKNQNPKKDKTAKPVRKQAHRKKQPKDNAESITVKKTMGKILIATGILVAIAACAAYFTFFGSKEHIREKNRQDKNAVYGVIMPEGYTIHGIDISHHQSDVDWDSLQSTRQAHVPITFIFMKATEGDDHVDTRFATYFQEARTHGFIRGAYHFFSPDTDPIKQAELFIAHADLTKGDLPPVLDIEKTGEQSEQELSERVLKWLRHVESHYGVSPIIYASKKFKDKYLSGSEFSSYPYWIAHYYKTSLEYDDAWSFWQHTDIGAVPGIKGDVDMDVFNGNAEDLSMMLLK